jgi:hypothetical protein
MSQATYLQTHILHAYLGLNKIFTAIKKHVSRNFTLLMCYDTVTVTFPNTNNNNNNTDFESKMLRRILGSRDRSNRRMAKIT